MGLIMVRGMINLMTCDRWGRLLRSFLESKVILFLFTVIKCLMDCMVMVFKGLPVMRMIKVMIELRMDVMWLIMVRGMINLMTCDSRGWLHCCFSKANITIIFCSIFKCLINRMIMEFKWFNIMGVVKPVLQLTVACVMWNLIMCFSMMILWVTHNNACMLGCCVLETIILLIFSNRFEYCMFMIISWMVIVWIIEVMIQFRVYLMVSCILIIVWVVSWVVL